MTVASGRQGCAGWNGLVRLLGGASVTLVPAAAAAQDVLHGTIAEQSYVEVEAAAKGGAIALWALGAIEEHGPHLPLSTDVAIPSAQLRGVRSALAGKGIESRIVPPYYWGVNAVTGAFTGSIHVRPETMIALMLDVFRSLRRSGFEEVYCITGHFDAAHGRAIADAVREANEQGILKARFVVPDVLGERLGLDPGNASFLFARWPAAEERGFPDLHAGTAETSAMLHAAPDKVDEALAGALPVVALDPGQLREWRAGGEQASTLTPRGYMGAPAHATATAGRQRMAREIEAYATAIEGAVSRSRARRAPGATIERGKK
ncbi:MAG: creatininase family protein [Sphingomonas sp.]|uniref:creatininase family protein n=1 Tax=Sphingomonas sp. TaxID=28214 RepID=UPI001B0D90ED|nr:creatininase family protein [Sphingomonas sp.]MBO9621563.1 creatininase family protein [Sphingomonas sp.]